MSHTENLTIMFTDIADYSESVAKLSRKESEEMLKVHDTTLHKVIKQYKGRWIKSIGDSLLVVFRSPTDAALCGMAMHDALWEQSQSMEDKSKQIRIRVALNLGEVRLTRNDVFGEAVNIAARLEGVTPADNIYLTEAVYLSMSKAEVLAVKEGSEKFKGSTEEIVYYKIPRSVSRRVVVDKEESGQFFDYPFGGKHLKSLITETSARFSIFSKAAIGLGALFLIGLTVFFFMRSDVPTEAIVDQDTGESLAKSPAEIGTPGGAEPPNKVEPVSVSKPLNETEPLSMLEPLATSEPLGEAESVNTFDPLNIISPGEPDTELISAESGETVIVSAEVEQAPSKDKDIRAEVGILLDEDDFAGLQLFADEYAQTNPGVPYLFIIQGHLLNHSSDYRDAIQAYQKGLEGDPTLAADEYLADKLVVLLEYQPTRTRALLKDNLSKEIIDRLSERTGQRGIQSRHYAVKLLEKSSNADKIDSVGMNIWDLRELKKCKEKKVAVVALRKLKDPAALPALQETVDGKFIDKVRNTCLWNEAKAAISEMEAPEG